MSQQPKFRKARPRSPAAPPRPSAPLPASPDRATQVKFWEKLCVGATAGIIGTSIVYPLDMIKTRLQRQKGPELLYKGPVHCFKRILREEGARGFYKGLIANLIGVTPEKAIKLAVTPQVNDGLRELWTDSNGHIPLYMAVLAGASAGACQCIATNPMEITKIRLQIQVTLPKEQQIGLIAVVRDLGLRGLYKGSSLTLMRDIPYSMIFFPLNGQLKTLWSANEDNVPMSGLIISGCLSGAFAAGLMTPMDVVKTRIQAQKGTNMEAKIFDLFKNVYKEEGLLAFYKGCVPRMCVQAPLFSIALTAFELQKRYIRYGKFFPKSTGSRMH